MATITSRTLTMTPQEKANLLVDCIKKALARGVKHYNAAGTELKTPLNIINCLLEEGEVECNDPYIAQRICNLTKN
jgi:hypothetical protein